MTIFDELKMAFIDLSSINLEYKVWVASMPNWEEENNKLVEVLKGFNAFSAKEWNKTFSLSLDEEKLAKYRKIFSRLMLHRPENRSFLTSLSEYATKTVATPEDSLQAAFKLAEVQDQTTVFKEELLANQETYYEALAELKNIYYEFGILFLSLTEDFNKNQTFICSKEIIALAQSYYQKEKALSYITADFLAAALELLKAVKTGNEKRAQEYLAILNEIIANSKTPVVEESAMVLNKTPGE